MTINEEEIIRINELYYKLKNYSAVARETNHSPATIKKYVIKDYVPKDQLTYNIKTFTIEEIPMKMNLELFGDNWGHICGLSDKEKEEMVELWKEMII